MSAHQRGEERQRALEWIEWSSCSEMPPPRTLKMEMLRASQMPRFFMTSTKCQTARPQNATYKRRCPPRAGTRAAKRRGTSKNARKTRAQNYKNAQRATTANARASPCRQRHAYRTPASATPRRCLLRHVWCLSNNVVRSRTNVMSAASHVAYARVPLALQRRRRPARRRGSPQTKRRKMTSVTLPPHNAYASRRFESCEYTRYSHIQASRVAQRKNAPRQSAPSPGDVEFLVLLFVCLCKGTENKKNEKVLFLSVSP